MASDDLQTLQNRNRSPPRSPFLATLLRRSTLLSKTDPRYPDINFKEQRRIVVMGAAKVGKSCIVHKFLYDQFTPKYSRTIEDLHVADYNLSTGASLTLEILDTTGSYQFPAMRALSISNANAFVLVYSVGDLESWRRIHDLRYEVSDEKGQACDNLSFFFSLFFHFSIWYNLEIEPFLFLLSIFGFSFL